MPIHTSLLAALAALLFAAGSPSTARAQDLASGQAVLMVNNQLDDTLTFHDPRDGRRLGEVRTGTHPHESVLSADGETAYVALYGSGIAGANPKPNHEIAIVSVRSMREQGRIDLGPFRAPHGVQLDPQGLLWVTAEENEGVIAVDPRIRRVVAHVPTGGRNYWVALTPDGSRAYTSNKNTPRIGVIDTASRQMTKRIVVPNGVQGLAVSPDGARLYAMDYGLGLLHVVDTRRGELVGAVQLQSELAPGAPPGAGRVQVAADGRSVLVTVNAAATLEMVNVARLASTKVIPAGASPMGVTIAPDGRTAFVAETGANTVAIVDLATGVVSGRFAVGRSPEFIIHAVLR